MPAGAHPPPRVRAFDRMPHVGVPTAIEVVSPGVVRTARLLLRPLREADRWEFVRVMQAGRASLAPRTGLFRAGESLDALFDRQREMCDEGEKRGTSWRRGAFLGDGRLAGCFNLNAVERGLHFRADANWWLSADCRGMGLGVEGVRALLDHALTDAPMGLGLHRVSALISPDNTASVRVATRAGMVRTTEPPVIIECPDGWITHDVYTAGVNSPSSATACRGPHP